MELLKTSPKEWLTLPDSIKKINKTYYEMLNEITEVKELFEKIEKIIGKDIFEMA